jgi:hypothetical protein
MGFFTDHERFNATSTVASDLERLDFRFRHVIERNKELIENKRVLDIASHDGRFSFAALRGAGATSVVGIEARDHLVKHAEETFAFYNAEPGSYRFLTGDVFEKLDEIEPNSIDTALVLGFLYHTARQYELISKLSKLGIKSLIVDSKVLRNVEKPYVLLEMERTQQDAMIWDESRSHVLSSVPSAAALELYLTEFGYRVTHQPPEGDVPKRARVYLRKGRVTMIGQKD